MKYKSLSLYLTIALFIVSIISGCGDKALFDELAENRIKVVIKGTYESNDPRPWTLTFPEDDSVYLHPMPAEDADPSTFMIDIAGIKVTTDVHDQYFANYRKTYAAPLTDTEAFFNGTGFLMENDDVRPGFHWQYLKIYFRKMIFDNAAEYLFDSTGSWIFDKDLEVLFSEETVNGLNFNLYQTLTYYDSLKNNYKDINRIFPLVVKIEDDLIFNNDVDETVLEIRLVIKNFIKKYESEYKDEDQNTRLRHFYALSDWLRDINKDEMSNLSGVNEFPKGGGNLLASARCYVPGRTAALSAIGSSAARSAASRYVIAVKYPHSIGEYQVQDRTRPACDKPKAPRQPLDTDSPAYVENMLDYDLQYNLYRENYDSYVDCVDNGNQYATEWDSYESRIRTFKLPPIATWSNSNGEYILTNVPVGFTYIIYQSTNDPGIGNLPVFDTTELTTVTVTEDQAGLTISL